MKKDPAFLFYSKDWLEGTAEMTHEEKGIYIDLLAHQHQKGDIPADIKRLCRLVGLSESEFSPIWGNLKTKFINRTDDRLVNRKLTEVTTERSTKSHTNRIIGHFAKLVRELKNTPPHIIKNVKASFKITDFDRLPTAQATERLTEWFTEIIKNGMKSIANGDPIIDHKGSNIKFPVSTDFNGLPDVKLGSAKQLISIIQKTNVSDNDILGMWDVFKVQNLTGKKHYESEDDVYSHFINWIKDKKFTQTSTGIKLKFD